jgi:hypothetical protein
MLGWSATRAPTLPGWELTTLVALVAGLLCVKRVGFAHPLAWFTILFTLYFLIGAQNWIEVVGTTTFRAHVNTNDVLRVPLLGLGAFAIGVTATAGTARPRRESAHSGYEPLTLRTRVAGYVLLVTGFIGVIVTAAKYGILLLHANERAHIPGAAALASLCLIPAGLILASSARKRTTELVWIGACAAALSLLAYRTPVLLLVGSFVIFKVSVSAMRQRTLLLVGVGLAALSLTIYNYRNAQSSRRIYGNQVIGVRALEYAPILTPLYYGFMREGTAVLSRITVRVPAQVPYYRGAVQLQALETLIPFGGGQTVTGRRRPDARDLVAELVYGEGEAATSITPTIVGGPYMDFGLLGVIVELALIGAGCGWMYLRARRPESRTIDTLIYAYVATLVALSIHSGLLDGVLGVALPVATAVAFGAAGLVSRSLAPGSDRTLD